MKTKRDTCHDACSHCRVLVKPEHIATARRNSADAERQWHRRSRNCCIQSDGPLAFDRLKSSNARQILIRFYNAWAVDLPPLDPPPFGSLSWSIGSRGELTLIVDLASASTRVSVAQGGNPNLVELRFHD